MNKLSEEARQLFTRLVTPVSFLGLILCKFVVAGSIVSLVFVALSDNPNVSPNVTLSFLWGAVVIAGFTAAWCVACYLYVSSTCKEEMASDRQTAIERKNQFTLVKKDQNI